MTKKIISLAVLLALLVSMATTYVVINQTSTDDEEISYSDYDIKNEDVEKEIGSSFVDEGNEIDIGEIL